VVIKMPNEFGGILKGGNDGRPEQKSDKIGRIVVGIVQQAGLISRYI
jgi:hypothetical protein